MPRVASNNTLAHNIRKTSSSPRAAGEHEKESRVQDKSQWRPSRIFESEMINKTAAVADYHINVNDLKTLPYKTSKATVKINGVSRLRPMYLYKERDVEMKAWEKYGGPEAFEKMLNDKAAKFYAKHGIDSGKAFPRPGSYHVANDPMPSRHARSWDEEYSKISPTLLRIKRDMESRGDNWLWDKLERTLNDYDSEIRTRDREEMMERALKLSYPQRPTSPAPESSSFKALTDLLEEAPSGYDDPGVDKYYDHATGDETVSWNAPYAKKVQGCLDAVKEEHGREGWEKARWLVYDKVCTGILRFDKNSSDLFWTTR
ncbi:hypothetical protein BDN70DRAFT_408987 [Pholiota conissans]|uniref:Uncharacterized protein n=1 Tax=Pholiota conissans TaxID=109636 RepID=A0A9P5Z9W1_9AGAR|nr:hypothetical protein BDN70DRAFT_408987 [Pholiota conissans]